MLCLCFKTPKPVIILLVIAIIPFYQITTTFSFSWNPNHVELVVASSASDDTTWLEDYFPQWPANIYTPDDASTDSPVTTNKSHEADAYLSYIIDHYERLPETVIFIRAQRFQHHQHPYFDVVPVLSNFQLWHVQDKGFSTLSCGVSSNSPIVLPDSSFVSLNAHHASHRSQAVHPSAFAALFPDSAVPKHIPLQRESQFAVSRTAIQARSRSEYVRYRDWLYSTNLPDEVASRIFESSWHIVFSQDSLVNSPTSQCFCEKFGLCDLNCSKYSCEKRYRSVYGGASEGWPGRVWPEKTSARR